MFKFSLWLLTHVHPIFCTHFDSVFWSVKLRHYYVLTTFGVCRSVARTNFILYIWTLHNVLPIWRCARARQVQYGLWSCLLLFNYCSSFFYLEFFVYFLIFFIYSQDAPILQEASQSHEVSFLLVATQLLTILKKISNLRSHNVMLNNFVVIINSNSYAIGR